MQHQTLYTVIMYQQIIILSQIKLDVDLWAVVSASDL